MGSITQKNSLLSLFINEHQINQVIDAISEGIIITSHDGKIRFINMQASRIIGSTADDGHGKDINDVFIVLDENSRKPILNDIKDDLYEEKLQIYEDECLLSSADEGETRIKLSIIPLRDLNDNISGKLIIFNHLVDEDRPPQDPVQVLQEHLKSLSHIKTFFGENHSATAIYYHNTAYLYYLQREYDKAISFYNNAIEIKKNVFGDNHLSVAVSYNDLGRVYHSLGEISKALEYFNKSLEIKKEQLGDFHTDIAHTYYYIGRVYHSDSDYAKAEEYYKMSLRIREEAFGREHIDSASSLNNLGGLFLSQNIYYEAILYFKEAYTVYKKILGDRQIKTAQVALSLGITYFEQGKAEDAEPFLIEAAETFLELSGPHHPNTINSYHWLAHLYTATGNTKDATAYREKTEYFKRNLI